MPYRRLPTTDASRLKSLKRAVELGKKLNTNELAFKQSTYEKINAFLPLFEQALLVQREAKTRQKDKNPGYRESFNKAKMYISHFFQVFNFGVMRGEIKPESRKYFGLSPNNSRVPDLISDADVVLWGERLIKGEKERTMKGEQPILSPKVQVVKVYYDQFIEKQMFQLGLKKNSQRETEKVVALRKVADKLIVQLWNEIENYYGTETPNRKREQAQYYGVVYFNRKKQKTERNPDGEDDEY